MSEQIINEKFSGMLSDLDIQKYINNGIKISVPKEEQSKYNFNEQLQLGSFDLHFRREYKRFNLKSSETLTYERLQNHDYTTPYELAEGEKLVVKPGEVIITTTLETIELSAAFAGIITGRSSIARLGIMVHCCQEFINPGHGQPIPLQIVNLGPNTVELDMNACICQIIFFKLITPASEKYIDKKDSKYSDETTPQTSKIYKDIDVNNKTSSKSVNRSHNIKSLLENLLVPFIPSLLMLLVITPFITETLVNKSLLDTLKSILTIPVTTILSFILIVIYIWVKTEKKQ